MRNASCGLIAALMISTALPATALGQDGDAVDNILACRGIADISARLACFDSAATELATARSTGDLLTVSREDVEAVEGDSFGFAMPSLPRLRLPSLAAFGGAGSQHDALAPIPGDAAAPAPAPAAAPAAAPARAPSTPDEPAVRPTPAPLQAPIQTPVQAPVQAPPARVASAEPAPASASVAPSEEPGGVAILERADDGDVFRVSMEIERMRTVGYNTVIFEMANGQVWRQADSGRVRLPRGDGHVAEIRRAALDSYLLRINGEGRAIRVRREE
ncbi:hypothetical protein [Maricaulis sp.]|uniref:hypothetical protein n=1 Tax=Maricaulis sp. TaxID=1486257 RepID=UPI0025C08CCD|nr:hypothetical protein [Maricaulis sp.]